MPNLNSARSTGREVSSDNPDAENKLSNLKAKELLLS